MKKSIALIIFTVILTLPMIDRELTLRRFNESVLREKHIYNSTVKIEILESLREYDYNQAIQNSGRLFIRGTIIHE